MREVIGACPRDCPDGCSWIVTVDGGDAVKLRGNPDHPFTAGGLCKKVNPWLEFARDPARILEPLRRTGPKGSGTFEPVTWDQALGDIAARLIEMRDHHGGEAIWPFTGTGNVGYIQGAGMPAGARLMNALGASDHSISICSISGHCGLQYTQGRASGMDPEEIRHAGTVLLWGSNTLVTNQHLWPYVQQARQAGAAVVTVDPVGTRTARRSDVHLQLTPGTDGALALTLCRLVRDEGAVDHDWITEHTEGYDEFSAMLDSWPLERGAEVCGLHPTEISRVAEQIIASPPLAIKLGQGMQRHAHGAAAARTVSCLAGVTGAFQRRGGGLVYSTAPVYDLDLAAARLPSLRPGPVRTLAMTNLVRELDGADPPVRALIVSGANPVVSNPDSDGVRRVLAREDLFTVAIEIFPTPTTAFADYVLPSAMQHEQAELNNSFSHHYLHWNAPAVEPAGSALSHTEIYRRLARALAVHDPRFHEPVFQATEEEYARALLGSPALRNAGVTLQRLQASGWMRLPDPPPIDRFSFVNGRAARDGLGRLPEWQGTKETTREGGYLLIANGSEWHVNTVFAQTEVTASRTSTPPVYVSSLDARRDGLTDRSPVTVSNDRGCFEAELRIDDQIARPGVASTTKGWPAQLVNRTVREEDSDAGHGAVYHDNRVRITAR